MSIRDNISGNLVTACVDSSELYCNVSRSICTHGAVRAKKGHLSTDRRRASADFRGATTGGGRMAGGRAGNKQRSASRRSAAARAGAGVDLRAAQAGHDPAGVMGCMVQPWCNSDRRRREREGGASGTQRRRRQVRRSMALPGADRQQRLVDSGKARGVSPGAYVCIAAAQCTATAPNEKGFAFLVL